MSRTVVLDGRIGGANECYYLASGDAGRFESCLNIRTVSTRLPSIGQFSHSGIFHLGRNATTGHETQLINARGRCRRSDLALKGLRMMLDQKTLEQGHLKTLNINNDNTELPQKYTLQNVVGAWTAAINACGKAGRMESAVKLIYVMPHFGVFPNTVTCGGCLTDCLLRSGRMADTLNVLRYMKKHRIAPSEGTKPWNNKRSVSSRQVSLTPLMPILPPWSDGRVVIHFFLSRSLPAISSFSNPSPEAGQTSTGASIITSCHPGF